MTWAVDVAVVGGGAIGCSVAYHAARRGARVVIVEAERLGSGSSGALAGMLSGQGELEPPGPFLELMLLGRNRHSKLSEELGETTGIDPGYVWDGALRTATDGASEEFLAGVYRLQKAAGLGAEWLTGDEARELEPALSPQVTAGLHLPDDGQVNPPQLVQALARGAVLWGGLRPGTPSGRPMLGPVEGWEGLLLATGHFRNGVLLSAITGEIVSSLALGEKPPTDVSPFLYESLLTEGAGMR